MVIGRANYTFLPCSKVDIFDTVIQLYLFDCLLLGQKIMNRLLSSNTIWGNQTLGIIRIIVGLLTIYHGHEVFRPELMRSYTEWDIFKGSGGLMKVYSGKSAELLAGISLALGLFTRLGGLMLAGTLGFITFVVGHGKFWYEDQHPFMFVLFGVLFFMMGPGAYSLDSLRNKKQS
jgi:putative oxidoreductase